MDHSTQRISACIHNLCRALENNGDIEGKFWFLTRQLKQRAVRENRLPDDISQMVLDAFLHPSAAPHLPEDWERVLFNVLSVPVAAGQFPDLDMDEMAFKSGQRLIPSKYDAMKRRLPGSYGSGRK